MTKSHTHKKENQSCSNLKEKFRQKKNVVIYENVVRNDLVGSTNLPLSKPYFCAYTEMKNVEPTIIKCTIWKLGQHFSSKE